LFDDPSKIPIADTRVIDLDVGVVVEKRECGHPRGSKTKPKVATMAASRSAPIKRLPGRPLGSKKKNPNLPIHRSMSLWM
jgi:hypothetical protein